MPSVHKKGIEIHERIDRVFLIRCFINTYRTGIISLLKMNKQDKKKRTFITKFFI